MGAERGIPEVRYAVTADGAHIAYQCAGEGPPDLLMLNDWVASIEGKWDHPAQVRMWNLYMSWGRFMTLDLRGLGCSDPVRPEELGDIDIWVEDAVAVLDAVGSTEVVVLGEGLVGHVATALAVRHPERVSRLVLTNSYPRFVRGDGYEHGMDPEALPQMIDAMRERWGTGLTTQLSAPRFVADSNLLPLAARMERLAASPSTAGRIMEVMASADLRPLLPQVTVPTLVLDSGDFAFLEPAHSVALADGIPGAQLMVVEAKSFAWGSGEDFARFREFITGTAGGVVGERSLAAVLFTDIVGSTGHLTTVGDRSWTRSLGALDAVVARDVEKHGGTMVKGTGDGHLATFPTPGAALRAAEAIRDAQQVLEVQLRIGLHVGEIEVRPDGDVAGFAVHMAARVMGNASPGEVLVTQTVVDLVSGSAFSFEDRGVQELRGIPGEWRLHAVAASA